MMTRFEKRLFSASSRWGTELDKALRRGKRRFCSDIEQAPFSSASGKMCEECPAWFWFILSRLTLPGPCADSRETARDSPTTWT